MCRLLCSAHVQGWTCCRYGKKMCESRRRRIRMGKKRTGKELRHITRHERMISEYRKLYREVEEAYGRDWI